MSIETKKQVAKGAKKAVKQAVKPATGKAELSIAKKQAETKAYVIERLTTADGAWKQAQAAYLEILKKVSGNSAAEVLKEMRLLLDINNEKTAKEKKHPYIRMYCAFSTWMRNNYNFDKKRLKTDEEKAPKARTPQTPEEKAEKAKEKEQKQAAEKTVTEGLTLEQLVGKELDAILPLIFKNHMASLMLALDDTGFTVTEISAKEKARRENVRGLKAAEKAKEEEASKGRSFTAEEIEGYCKEIAVGA